MDGGNFNLNVFIQISYIVTLFTVTLAYQKPFLSLNSAGCQAPSTPSEIHTNTQLLTVALYSLQDQAFH